MIAVQGMVAALRGGMGQLGMRKSQIPILAALTLEERQAAAGVFQCQRTLVEQGQHVRHGHIRAGIIQRRL